MNHCCELSIADYPDLYTKCRLFEGGLRTLALNLFPRVTAGRAHGARERLLDAIEPYFANRLIRNLRFQN
jgi:hypothetical protein